MKITCMIVLAALCWNQSLQRKVSKKASETQDGPTIDELFPNDVSDDSPPAASPTGKDERSVNDAPQLTKYPVSNRSSPMSPHAKDTNSLNSGNAPQFSKYPTRDTRKPDNLTGEWVKNEHTNDLKGGDTNYPNKDHNNDPNKDHNNDPNKDLTDDQNKYLTNDPNKEYINDPNKDLTDDPNKDHNNDPNKDLTNDPNKEYTNDPNMDHTNYSHKDHTNDPNKEHTNDPNKDHNNDPNKDLTNDPNKEYTNDPNMDHTNDSHKDHNNDPNKEHTNDPSKDHTNYQNKEYTNDPNKDHTNDLNKEYTNDPNKDHTNDLNRDHTNDLNEHHTNDPNKEHTYDPSKDHTNDPNKDHTNDQNRDRTNDPNKDHTNDQNRDHTNDPNGDHINDLSKDHTNDPNKDHTNDPNKDHTNDLNGDHINDLNEHHTNDPNKEHTYDPSKDRTNDPNKDRTNDQNRDHTNDPNGDHINDLSKDHTNDPNKDHTNDPNKDHTNDLNGDHTNDPNGDHINDLSKDHTNDPNKDHTNDPNKDHTNDLNDHHTNDPNKEHTNDPVNEYYDRKIHTKFGQKGESKMEGSPTHALKEPEEMMHGSDHETILTENERLMNGGNSNEREQKPEKNEGGGEDQHLERPEKEQDLEKQNVKDDFLPEEKRNGKGYNIETDESEEQEEEPTNGILPQMSDGNVLWSKKEAEHDEEPWEEGGESSYYSESQPREYISELISGKQGTPKDLKERWDSETNAKGNTLERVGRRQDELVSGAEDSPSDLKARSISERNTEEATLTRVKRESVGGGRSDYRGCYHDYYEKLGTAGLNKRDLTGYYGVFNDNSHDNCISICIKKGFKFASMQIGLECFCGDEYGKYGQVDESKCKVGICPGKNTFCGGPKTNIVFRTGFEMDNFLGCFKDDKSDWDLPTIVSQSWTDNSPAKCIKTCRGKRSVYAGVQGGTGCFCGDSYGEYGKADAAKCNTACSGLSVQICGGNNHNSIYRTGTKRTTGRENYLGCYFDKEGDRDLPTLISSKWTKDNSPAKCIASCYCQHFIYAGVQHGVQCLCGNTYGKHYAVNETDCNSLCSGLNKTICGGAFRNSVYFTGYGDYDGPAGSTPTDTVTATQVYTSITPQSKTSATSCVSLSNIGVKVYWVAMDLTARTRVSKFRFWFSSKEKNFYSVVSSKADVGIFPPPKEVICQFQRDEIDKKAWATLSCNSNLVGRYVSLIKYSTVGFHLCGLKMNAQTVYALKNGADCDENSQTDFCITGSTCLNNKCRIVFEGHCNKTEECATGLVCDFLLRLCKQAYDEECTNDDMCLSNSVCDDGKCKYGFMAICDGNPDSCATGLSCDLKDTPNLCKVELNSACEPEECTSDAVCDFAISQCRVAIKYDCSNKARLCATATYCDPRNKCGNGVGDRCTHEGKDDPCVAGALCTGMDECRCHAKVAKRKGKICEPKPGKYLGSCNETQPCDKNMACVDKVCDCSQGYISTQLFGCKEEMSASTAGGNGGQVVLATVLGTVFGVALVAVLAGVGYMQRKRSQEAKMSPGPANPALPGPSNPVSPGQANPMSPGPSNPK